MNFYDILKAHEILTDEAYQILKEKVQNYSGQHGDPYTNFRRVEQLGICSLETGLLARISDKLGRLITHVNSKGGLVGDETVTDSVHDLINYLVFLHCLIVGGTVDERE